MRLALVDDEQRVVAEAAGAARRRGDRALADALDDARLAAVRERIDEREHAAEARAGTAVGDARRVARAASSAARSAALFSASVARSCAKRALRTPGPAVERVDLEARVVGQREHHRRVRDRARLLHRVLGEGRAVLHDAAAGRAAPRRRPSTSTGSPASSARSSSSLPRLPVATTSVSRVAARRAPRPSRPQRAPRGRPRRAASTSRCSAASVVDAREGQVDHRVDVACARRARLRPCPAPRRSCRVAVATTLRSTRGLRVFDVAEVEREARARRGSRRSSPPPARAAARDALHLRERERERDEAARDRRRARPAVGLEHVAVDGDRARARACRRSTAARSARPTRRWISCVRPLGRLAAAVAVLARAGSRAGASGTRP